MKKTIFLTGGAGYLGSILSNKLIQKGYGVKCYDTLFYGAKGIEDIMKNDNFKLIKDNTVYVDKYIDELKDCYAVIHLAELANDPSCDLDPEMTEVFNVQAPIRIANMAKECGVKRFLFSSSCSVYGKGHGEDLSEYSPLNPLTKYAESKVRVESELLKLADSNFSPTMLRLSTLFGYSRRMRFDLSINIMTKHAVVDKKVIVLGGGGQWRPFLHVADAADAFLTMLEAEEDDVRGEIFNVGSNNLNYRIVDLAYEVKKCIPETEVEVADIGVDERSYKVNFNKINRSFGYLTKKTVKDGVMEIVHGFQRGELEKGEHDIHHNVKLVQKLLNTPVLEKGEPICYRFIPFSLPQIGEDEEMEVIDTLRSGWLTTGPKTKKFEEMLAEYTGAKHCVALSSCTAALHLCLAALGIKEGDEVITTPVTWPATANVVVHCGATPVFVDVERGTLNIDPAKIEEKITKKTKVIIPVHMAGQPCDMDAIHKIAKKHNLIVIEDAAHAIGAEYKKKKIGSMSRAACFSFYPIKNITTGEGGAVTTNDKELAEKIRMLSLHGVSANAWKRYSKEAGTQHHEVLMPGFKCNMSDIQASLGIHQLKKLDHFIHRRQDITQIYNDYFKNIAEMNIPKIAPYPARHAHHLYIMQLNLEKLKINRDEFIRALKAENIGCGIHFRSLHIQPYYRDRFKFKPRDFPNAAFISERIISLPLYPKMTQDNVTHVTKIIDKLISYYGAR